MKYQKFVENGYIISVAEVVDSDVNLISEEEYHRILEVMQDMPIEDGYYFMLREDLTWERFECEEEQEEDTDDDEESDES